MATSAAVWGDSTSLTEENRRSSSGADATESVRALERPREGPRGGDDGPKNAITARPPPEEVEAQPPLGGGKSWQESNAPEGAVTMPSHVGPTRLPPTSMPPRAPHERRTVVILLAGIDGAGKSTLLASLCGDQNPRCRPSLGFRPVSLEYGDRSAIIKFYDLGGGPRIRGIWENYFHDVHGVIYVVDAAADDARMEEATLAARVALGHRYLQGKPCLAICNKSDKPAARSSDVVQREMRLSIREDGGHCKIVEASVHPQKAGQGGEPDPAIESGLEWLIGTILDDIEALSERVAEDTARVSEAREVERALKERRVMATSICKAFGLEGEDGASDTFDQGEGEDFLAQEIGLEGGSEALPEEGAR